MVKYKRKCFQGSSPYYTLQLVQNFKAWGSTQDNRKKEKEKRESKKAVEGKS